MTVIEIRNQIIQKLQEINDLSFLEAVKTIIDSKTEKQKVFYINEEMENILHERKEKIEKGEFIDNDSVFKESEEWLKGK
ncbi:MAG: hypothetical protein K8S00_04015 [Bacteroidales bacterium]|nr:hypothetical protein [Bacteroidales bacterium]